MKTHLAVISALAFGAAALASGQSTAKSAPARPADSVTQGSISVEGARVDYTATAGTILIKNIQGQPTGSMFYVAYTKNGVQDEGQRPVTFFYNGGPGSSTIWLHMGAFGPQRIATVDVAHTPAAPYKLVSNEYSLLDATDEVFIDAMSTGYSRILGKDQGGVGTNKDFYGVDPDVKAFGDFITSYLSQNNRWNSPKYLYGESYGTVRSELLANYLEQTEDIDPNGVILQSAYTGDGSFGSDREFETDLPTFAAVAWYHKKLPAQAPALPPFLAKVEQFAMNQYAVALNAGNTLSPAEYHSIAETLHEYTGLDTALIEKANLRISEGLFRREVMGAQDETVGDLDGRFSGPSMDRMSLSAQYDPQSASISAAYVAGFNQYMHNVLKYGKDQVYRPEAYGIVTGWTQSHQDPLTRRRMPVADAGADLAEAMKYNPGLRVEVDAGYFDLNLPYYGMVYSVNHLNLPKDLQSHIDFKYYGAGHMIYVNVPALKQLHDNTAAFIHSTEGGR